MTYLELINNFWREFEEETMSSNDTLLYFFLLDYCNKNRWKNPFSLSNKNLMLMLEISEKTIIGARDRLSKKGLINYEGGVRNCKAPIYFIAGAEYNNFNCKISSSTADEWQKNGRRTAALFKDYKTKDKKKYKEKLEPQDDEVDQRTTNQRGDASKGVQSKLPPKPGYGLIEPDDDC